jgi:uncharacterized protein
MEPENRLKQKLFEDLRQAMKSGQTARRECLRLLISAVNYTEIARQAPLTDADIYGVIGKEIKQRRESIDAFKAGNRPDLVAKEEAELATLLEYQPRQMNREEVTAEAKKIIAEVGAQGARDKGKVMPKLIAQLKGKAEGRMINEVVTELLK